MKDLLLEPMAEPGVGGRIRKGYAASGVRLESLSDLETSQKVRALWAFFLPN
jgi:hypothetical protein